VAAIFSSGTKTPLEVCTGNYEGGWPGGFVFLLLVIGGAASGGFIAPKIL